MPLPCLDCIWSNSCKPKTVRMKSSTALGSRPVMPSGVGLDGWQDRPILAGVPVWVGTKGFMCCSLLILSGSSLASALDLLVLTISLWPRLFLLHELSLVHVCQAVACLHMVAMWPIKALREINPGCNGKRRVRLVC